MEAKKMNTKEKIKQPVRNLKSVDKATQKDNKTAHIIRIQGFIL